METTDSNLQHVRGGAEFALELIDQLISSNAAKENILVSPFCIQACMAMSFAGANGETADEIAKAMKYVSNSPPEVAEAFKHILDQYKDSELVEMANKIYLKNGLNLKSEYQKVVEQKYYAAAEVIDFAESAKARDTINTKIVDGVPPDIIGSNTLSILINALHFKGERENAFENA